MILNFLGPSGFEDLIAIWLFDRFNYFVIPSTNKKSTQKYEFVMLDGSKENGNYSNKKRIYLQAKNGEVDLNIKDYLNLLDQSGDEVWLATSSGKVHDLDGIAQQNQIIRLKKNEDSYDYQSFGLAELIDFVFDDANRSILPDSIMTLLTFFSKED